jgi:hypothetical protein
MTYCTLEEAWGKGWSETKKKQKKSKKDRKYEREEKKAIHEAVDPKILIPETHRMADYRKDVPDMEVPESNEYPLSGYDNSLNSYSSPYQRYATDPLKKQDESILANNKKLEQLSVDRTIQGPLNDIVTMSRGEYEKLKNKVSNNLVEGFVNTTDEQFNQLILYIFTGIFYILMLDVMYQLGKKSF